jgi:O-antigen biosynthesis protein
MPLVVTVHSMRLRKGLTAMLVYVWSPEDNASLTRRTAQAAGELFPEADTLSDAELSFDELNRRLSIMRDGWLVTLPAGSVLLPELRATLERWMERLLRERLGWVRLLPARQAGERAHETDESKPLGLTLWHLGVITAMAGGAFRLFPGADELPFRRYAELDGWLHAKQKHQGVCEACASWRPPMRRSAAWRKQDEEFAAVRPLLGPAFPPPKDAEAPEISIVLCAYNAADYVMWAVRSVFRQSSRRWELVVVDDGSEDDTAHKLSLLPNSERIVRLRSDVNRGKAHALNLALMAARGRLLLELDADDWLPPDSLSKLLAAEAESGARTALWYGDYMQWQERVNRELVLKGYVRSGQLDDLRALLLAGAPLIPRMYRTDALREIGGWSTDDPSGGRLYEDMNVIARLSQQYELKYIPAPLYHRRMRRASVTRLHSKAYEAWGRWAADRYCRPEGEAKPQPRESAAENGLS